MEETLLLDSFDIFDNPTLIDQIHQVMLNWDACQPDLDEILCFLKKSEFFLSKNLKNDEVSELFCAILQCFSLFSNDLIPVLEEFSHKSRQNSYYVLLIFTILPFLIKNQPNADISNLQSFVCEIIDELSPQLTNLTSILQIFSHEIPKKFQDEFIVNVAISSLKIQKKSIQLHNYIFNVYWLTRSQSFDIFLNEYIKTDLYSILPQTNSLNDELLEIISNNDDQLFSKISEEASSLVKFIVSYVRVDFNNKIKGLTSEIILPFAAILSIYLQKSKNQSFVSLSNQENAKLIENAIQNLSNNNSLINTSINTFLTNYMILIKCNFITLNEFIQIISVLTSKMIYSQFYSDKMILIKTIFDLIKQNDSRQIDILEEFQYAYLTDIFSVIYQNLNDFYNCRGSFKPGLIDLNFVDQKIHRNHFQSIKTVDDMIRSVYLYEKICTNQPIIPFSNEVSNLLVQAIEKQIENKKFNDVLMISRFMKNNTFEDQLKKIDKIPKIILLSCFSDGNKAFETDYQSIDELLIDILADPDLENHGFLFKKLLKLMITDEDNLFCYLSFLINFNNDMTVKHCLNIYFEEYNDYQEMFIKVTNLYFYYNKKIQTLITRNNFFLDALPISPLGTSIISKLFESVKDNLMNYQAFLCLRSIASTIPNLFHSNIQQIFDIILPPFNNLYLIFEDNSNDEEKLLLSKTAYASLLFTLSMLHSYVILEYFMDWVIINIVNFTDSQVFGFIYILRSIMIDSVIISLLHIYIQKHNLFDKLTILLDREVHGSELFKKNYMLNLIYYINSIYTNMSKYTPYVIVQDEMLSKLEKPFSFIYSKIFSSYPIYGMRSKIQHFNLPIVFKKIIDSFTNILDFWISYEKQNNYLANSNNINEFTSKLTPYENFFIPIEYLTMKKPVTIRMAKHVVMCQFWIYSHFLYNNNYNYVRENGEIFVQRVKELNQMYMQAMTNPVDEDDIDVELINPIDCFLSDYCQPSLINNIIELRTNHKLTVTDFADIYAIEIFIPLYLEQISKALTKYSDYPDKIENLFDLIDEMKGQSNFVKNFIDLCASNLINVILLPKNRDNSSLLLKVSNFLINLETELPIQTIYLVYFLINLEIPEAISSALKLSSKINPNYLEYCNDIILNSFDNELTKNENTQMFFDFFIYVPSILKERRLEISTLLENQIEKYSNRRDNKTFDFICYLMNALAPRRGDSISISSIIETASTIPENIMNSSPKFWSLFAKCQQVIMEKVVENPLILEDKLNFLLEYPEIIDFKIRSSYFKKVMKRRIKYDELRFTVDFDNLLSSSYTSIHQKSPQDLLKRFRINVVGSPVIDVGGVTKEWFTRLAKEIFNQNYGLFDCTENKQSYKPSSHSYIHPNYISYFRFAGIFIARALIEGICIDAHLTSSFCKQILHRRTNLKDLEDFDETLFKSFEWILRNDVEPLSLYFDIDTDDFGEHKTIPLKENGSDIEVTNDNKEEYINLRANYVLNIQIQNQIEAFCNGFDELIPHKYLRLFTANELDLLICGVPSIDVEDFRRNMTYEYPYHAESKVVKLFFEAISKWDNEDLAKLLMFMTGSSRVPLNGFKEFVEITGSSLKIGPGGDRHLLPSSHTCFNQLDLPMYENLEEMDKKLKKAIQMCNSFEIA